MATSRNQGMTDCEPVTRTEERADWQLTRLPHYNVTNKISFSNAALSYDTLHPAIYTWRVLKKYRNHLTLTHKLNWKLTKK